MRGYIAIQQPGDKEIVSGYIADFASATLQALVDQYNRAYQQGFFWCAPSGAKLLGAALGLFSDLRFVIPVLSLPC